MQTGIQDAQKASQTQSASSQPEPQCCPFPPQCGDRVLWRARFADCPTTFATGPEYRCEVNPIPPRYSVADLNPLIWERNLRIADEWNPYEHFDARQKWVQFMYADMTGRSNDPYTRPISSVGDTYCNQVRQHGTPAYVNF